MGDCGRGSGGKRKREWEKKEEEVGYCGRGSGRRRKRKWEKGWGTITRGNQSYP